MSKLPPCDHDECSKLKCERLEPHEGRGVADFQCNACGKIVKRDLGWKVWTKSFCGKTGKNARLYRISAPKDLN